MIFFRSKRVLSILAVMSLFLCFLVRGAEARQLIYDDLFSVSFPTEKDGWASGRWGCILHTSDGGKTWVRQNTGTDLTLASVFFIDAQHGWAVGEEGVVIHTKDAGKTWTKQKSPLPYFHMKVFFVTADIGYIVSEWTHIFYTVDGGKNWQVRFKDQDFILKSISFCDRNNGWAVGEYGFIYHTRDGGATWQQQGGGFGISETTGDVEAGTYLFDVAAIDPQTAWAVGIEGYVIKTVDGGKSWQDVSTKSGRSAFFSVLAQKSGAILVGGDGVVLHSSDNGKTWKSPTFAPPVTYSWIYGVGSRGNAGFVAVGANGVIYLSEGKNVLSWKQVEY
jgi:photosystem II stability/assembly factor-like uncharacterized protein